MTKGALDGVKIVDLSRMAPGPFCSMMLGDMAVSYTHLTLPTNREV